MASKIRNPGTGRFGLVTRMLLVSMGYFAAIRLALVFQTAGNADLTLPSLAGVFAVGALYDLAFYGYALLPVLLYLTLLPERLWQLRAQRWLTQGMVFATLYGLGFIAVAEWLFWQEFNVRFNFIAVDYLVYRREVTDNIRQSYPVPLLLGLIALATVLVFRFLLPRLRRPLHSTQPLRSRLLVAGLWALLPLSAYLTLGQDLKGQFHNNYQQELAGNGPYEFIAAFRNNTLDYDRFYATLPAPEVARLLRRELLGESGSQESAAGTPGEDAFDLTHWVDNPGPQRRWNIFLVMIESLSARYVGAYGDSHQLTPNLDALARNSLFFEQMYATGTRTTRGLEAVTLSVPPTPGRSIVKRIGHESGLFSLGDVLRSRGYQTRFIYGGHGYFDNMNAFFAGNGYSVTDRGDIPDQHVTFENAWGVADEDLYRQALLEADKAHAAGHPFFFHLMTTSNHRPYTYPAGRVDIPSGDGRYGAVKYTDWAIGDLLRQARQKPWFDNTLFVFVADHTAGSAGKVSLPVPKYHIPLLIYAPKLLPPARIDKVASQIDIGPTLLALLGVDYQSRFFGKNILAMTPGDERALIGTYQKLGLYKDHTLSILSPVRQMTRERHADAAAPVEERLTQPDDAMRLAIAYYQGASYIYRHGLDRWPIAAVTRPPAKR